MIFFSVLREDYDYVHVPLQSVCLYVCVCVCVCVHMHIEAFRVFCPLDYTLNRMSDIASYVKIINLTSHKLGYLFFACTLLGNCRK